MSPGARLAAAALAIVALLALPGPAAACSPPFEQPTIAALGPDAVVIVGTTGELTPAGRLFHVERVFNGPIETTPIVIAFQEGEPVGDCSYPVNPGMHLVIAPDRLPDGRLGANLVTLQADPASADGLRYLQEATELFGPGHAPPAATDLAVQDAASPLLLWLVVAVVIALGAAVLVLVVRRARRAT